MFHEYIDKLILSELFLGMSREDIASALSCLRPELKLYNKGDLLICYGSEIKSIGLILNGRVLVTKNNYLGNRVVLSKLKPLEVYGAMAAFAEFSTSPADIIADSELEIMLINKDRIVSQCSHACEHHQKLIRNFLKIISNRALALNRRVELLSIKSIQGKLATFLLNYYERTNRTSFDIGLNRSQLAEYLNVSRTSMVRELKNMKLENIIDYYLNSFKLLDLELLQRKAGL